MKILIVDDDPMVAHINLKFANKAGYDDVDTAADIESAKERLRQGDIDLVLLDAFKYLIWCNTKFNHSIYVHFIRDWQFIIFFFIIFISLFLE